MMTSYKQYELLTKTKPFSYCVKIALLLFSKEEAYEVLKEDASKVMLEEGVPSAIFERVVSELLGIKAWYLPDELKLWDERFGSLFQTKFFCYDDDDRTWQSILEKYFVRLDYLPKKEDYTSQRSYNNAWGYFAELLAVVKENKHQDFEHYYHLALQKGMSEALFKRKVEELRKIKARYT